MAWPGRSQHSQHTSERESEDHGDLYAADIDALRSGGSSQPPPLASPRLGLVDLKTGEIKAELTTTDEPTDPDG